MVSHYFHLPRRRHAFRYHPESLSSMLRHRRFGIGASIDTLNDWLEEWEGQANVMRLRYEDVRADPDASFRAMLAFSGFAPVNEEALALALELEFSRFENMRAMEASGRFAVPELRPGDVGDVESFKTRRGKVAGFRDYLDAGDRHYASRAMERLDPGLGYDRGM